MLPIRIQSQVPSEKRTWVQMLENIGGTVVNGKVHPPRLVIGSPAFGGANWGFVTVITNQYSEKYNGYKISFVADSDEYYPNKITVTATGLVFSYISISTTVAMFATALTAIDLSVYSYAVATNGLMVDAITLFQDVPITDGKEIECLPIASKDFHRSIQNCGTNAVKILIGAGHASASQFHKVLSACQAQDDGLGGNIQILARDRVTAIGADGAAVRLAVTRIESPEAI